jgi:hypothetical protein
MSKAGKLAPPGDLNYPFVYLTGKQSPCVADLQQIPTVSNDLRMDTERCGDLSDPTHRKARGRTAPEP